MDAVGMHWLLGAGIKIYRLKGPRTVKTEHFENVQHFFTLRDL
jgi:hypothetical protein